MRVTDLRAGGMGVPQIFELDDHDREVLEEFAKTRVWSIYNADVYVWADRDWMMQQIEEAVERGGGERAAEKIVDQFAADMGLERA